MDWQELYEKRTQTTCLYSLGAQAEPWGLWHRQLCQADKSTLGLVRSVMTFKYSCYKLSRERKEYFYFSLCYILKSFIFTIHISLCVSNMCIQGWLHFCEVRGQLWEVGPLLPPCVLWNQTRAVWLSSRCLARWALFLILTSAEGGGEIV